MRTFRDNHLGHAPDHARLPGPLPGTSKIISLHLDGARLHPRPQIDTGAARAILGQNASALPGIGQERLAAAPTGWCG